MMTRATRRSSKEKLTLSQCKLAVSLSAWIPLLGCTENTQVIAHESAHQGGPGVHLGGATGEGSRPEFEDPEPITQLNDPIAKDQDPTLTADLLQIFFFSDRSGEDEIWTARRPSVAESWGVPEQVVELGSPSSERNPFISRDGTRIWFHSTREPIGIWYAERADLASEFSQPVALDLDLTGLDSGAISPSLTPDFLRMAVSIGASDTRNIYELARPTENGVFSPPALVEGLESDFADSTPFLIDEGLELLFSSGRTGGGDLYWARRNALPEPVVELEALTELNDPTAFESHPHLAADRSWVFFGSSRSGGTDLFQARAR